MPYVLPHRYRYAHDYAIYLYDHVVQTIRSLEVSGVLPVPVELTPEEAQEFSGLQGVELFDWMIRTGRHDVVAEMNYKSVFHAVAADFCNFVLEGLRASAKGKLTVSYALFRKPFRDNLFYLEWLAGNPVDFLVKFQVGSPGDYDVTKLDESDKRRVINDAADVAGTPGVDPSKLYEYRYDKRSENGLGGTWDKALHLITTWRHNETERNNLNFIFSGPDQWESQWANVYWMLPYLLHHATYVVDAIVDQIADVEPTKRDEMFFRRAIGYELWASYSRHESPKSKYHPSMLDLIQALPRPLCRCSDPQLATDRRALRKMVKFGILRCRLCRSEAQLIDALTS